MLSNDRKQGLPRFQNQTGWKCELAILLIENLGLPADSVCRDVLFNRVENRQHICLRFIAY